MLKDSLLFISLKTTLFPFRFLPHSFLHIIGKSIGSLLFYLLPSYRKRALSNLCLAKKLKLSEKNLKKIAKESFQNLAITCLEYPKLLYTKNLSSTVICENPEQAEALIAKGQGIIFFCGHQSNWEVLFLDGTLRMPGVAIGRPIKNRFIYQWIVSIRERFGGKIITPNNALKEGIRALRNGKFLGVVGDQGMPGSGFSSDFLGTKAWTSPAPALLACRTNSPIMVATTRRKNGKYFIHYSDPIWPNPSEPAETQVPLMMDQVLKIFEKSIINSPGEWLWQHNRWKQETSKTVYYKYRYDTILILLPSDSTSLSHLLPHIGTFREIYPEAFITVAINKKHKSLIQIPTVEFLYYENNEELFIKNYLYKLVFNFTSEKKLKKHFLKYSAFKVLSLENLQKESAFHTQKEKETNLSDIFKQALCRPGTLWKK